MLSRESGETVGPGRLSLGRLLAQLPPQLGALASSLSSQPSAACRVSVLGHGAQHWEPETARTSSLPLRDLHSHRQVREQKSHTPWGGWARAANPRAFF